MVNSRPFTEAKKTKKNGRLAASFSSLLEALSLDAPNQIHRHSSSKVWKSFCFIRKSKEILEFFPQTWSFRKIQSNGWYWSRFIILQLPTFFDRNPWNLTWPCKVLVWVSGIFSGRERGTSPKLNALAALLLKASPSFARRSRIFENQ